MKDVIIRRGGSFMKKRMISIIVCMCASLLLCSCSQNKGSNANGEKSDVENGLSIETILPDESPESDFEFRDETNGVVITKYKGDDKTVSVPAIIKNKKVVGIEKNVFPGNVVLEEIVIPEYITSLDFSHFENCDNLKSIICLGDIETFGNEYPTLKSLKKIGLPAAKGGIDAKVLDKYSSISMVDVRGVSDVETIKKCFDSYNNDNMSITISEQLFETIENESWVYMLYCGSWGDLSQNKHLNIKGDACYLDVASAFSKQENVHNDDVGKFYEKGSIPSVSLEKIKEKSRTFYDRLSLSSSAKLIDQSQWINEDYSFDKGQYGRYVYKGIFEAENSNVYVIAGLNTAYFHCFFKDVDQQFCLTTNTEKIIVNGREFSMANVDKQGSTSKPSDMNLFESYKHYFQQEYPQNWKCKTGVNGAYLIKSDPNASGVENLYMRDCGLVAQLTPNEHSENVKYSIYSFNYIFMSPEMDENYLFGLLGKNEYQLNFNQYFVDNKENKGRDNFKWTDNIENNAKSIEKTKKYYKDLNFYQLNYTFNADGTKWKGSVFFMEKDGGYHVITIETSTDKWNDYYPTMEEMLYAFYGQHRT